MVKIALFGYAQSGKTALFRRLTGKKEDVYDPFKPNAGVGIYKDCNIARIAEIQKARKMVYPEFEIYDFKGFPEGEGFPANYYRNLFDKDIIICVVGNFSPEAHPEKEAMSLLMELAFYDTERIQKMLDKEQGASGGAAKGQAEVFKKGLVLLEKEKMLNELCAEDKKLIQGTELVTVKSVLIYINGDAKPFNLSFPFSASRNEGGSFDAEGFYEAVIKSLSLITFYTIKGEIVQGWIIPSRSTARQAAGKVHKDIEKGFIKAAALHLKDLIEIGSWHTAKNMGVLKFLGPNSEINDCDVIEFFFS
ncbi:MAG: DUF933 domain-containing protein [Candidatus Omnitrophica bacterium]|nr:DUF933 domain-containing protein [Candidatus Omnitrophota bacterium]